VSATPPGFTPSPGWERAERVLAVRLDTLGDVLMTTPAIRALARSNPRRRVSLLTSPSGAEAGRLAPEVDEVLPYQAPWMKPPPPGPGRASRTDPAAAGLEAAAEAGQDHDMIRRLRRGRFDAAVIFTVYSQSPLPAALLCHLAGIPLRLAHCREQPYALLTDRLAEPEPERTLRHEVRRQLDLVAAVGCSTADERLSLAVGAPARRRAARMLAGLGIDREERWAVLHVGATAPSRRYPPESFVAAARELAAGGWRFVLTGTAGERPLVEAVREGIGPAARTVAGLLDLETTAALVAAAPVLVSNNTGPAHVAAAVGTPVVVLYALTNPQHTPWMVPSRVLYHDVPCRFCYASVCPQGHHRCLRGVPPSAVAEAVRELVAPSAAAGDQPEQQDRDVVPWRAGHEPKHLVLEPLGGGGGVEARDVGQDPVQT
jgi:lipopolysaccharide heptosyltransferase II